MNLNLNNINKKIVLFFSLLGFILSFISGLITGSSFINLFFHSIISGLVIGLIIAISNIVIMIYLPELLENGEDDDIDISDSDGHVNIVMPEEKYNVQTGDINEASEDDVNTESTGSASDSSFKEVDLDNLKNLSSASESIDSGNFNSFDSNSDDKPPISSSIDGATDVGKHSIEDMTKAVKTVLKKD